MAANTNIELRQKMMYSLFVRNHTTEGTFAAVEKDLDRIQALGTDIIRVMPIQPKPTADTSRPFPKIRFSILCNFLSK